MFTHDIDPIIATVGSVHVWWYGAGLQHSWLYPDIDTRPR